jgi:hypothetical protein
MHPCKRGKMEYHREDCSPVSFTTRSCQCGWIQHLLSRHSEEYYRQQARRPSLYIAEANNQHPVIPSLEQLQPALARLRARANPIG